MSMKTIAMIALAGPILGGLALGATTPQKAQGAPGTSTPSSGGILMSSAGGGPILDITSPVPIGSFGTISISGTPGNMAVLGLSYGPGPIPLWFGVIDLSLPLISVIKLSYPGNGLIQVPFKVNCNPSLVGRKVYGQALDVDLATAEILISNPASMVISSEYRGAWEYDLFASGDVTMSSTDVGGRMAAGGSVTLTNFSLALSLQGIGASFDDNLVVGSDLVFTNGTVYAGNVVHGGTATLTNVSVPDGTVSQGSPLDFVQVKTELIAISDGWQALPAVMTSVDFDPLSGTMNLTGTSALLNVFDVTGADLDLTTGMFLDAPASSTCIYNVSGVVTSLTMLGFDTGDVPSSQVSFNFNEAESLLINGVGITASILAPNADIDFDNGVVVGQIACKSLNGSGQVNHALFDACVTDD